MGAASGHHQQVDGRQSETTGGEPLGDSELGSFTPLSYCPACGNTVTVTGASAFCGSCGHALASGVVQSSAAEQPTAEHTADAFQAAPGFQAAAGFHTTPPPVYLPPPGYPAAVPYPGMPPAPRKTNTGLIVGLAGAAPAAVGVIAAVILLAGGNGGGAPVITTTTVAQPVTPVVPGAGTATATGPATAGGGSAGGLVKSTPAASTQAPTISTPASSSGSSTGVGDIEAARQVVDRHWALINAGNFTAAFALFVPGSQGDESLWVSAHQQDAPISASVSVGTPTFNSSTDATVPVLTLHTVSGSGCSNWTGSYAVQKVGGQWLINKANLQSQTC